MGRSNLELLNDEWKSYVLALNDLGTKLSASYNIETILAPLDVQISDAIMNFQENYSEISRHVAMACDTAISPVTGPQLSLTVKPKKKLTKRSANPINLSVAPVAMQNRHFVHNHASSVSLSDHLRAVPEKNHQASSLRTQDLTFSSLKKPSLIDEIRNYLLTTKSFWLAFPNSVCTSNYTLGPNAARKQVNCFEESFKVADVNADLRYINEVKRLTAHLASMRSKIDKALLGEEINWSENISEQNHPMVPSMLNSNSRVIHPTVTHTTTTPEPDGEDGELDEINNDPGSGEEPSEDHETEEDSESSEDLDPSTEPSTESEESSNEDPDLESASIPSDHLSDLDSPYNSIDGRLTPQMQDDSQLNLITPPTQSDAQRSSQTSSKLVIDNLYYTVFANLILVILFIVHYPRATVHINQ